MITAIVKQLGIHQVFASPYDPLINGTVERAKAFVVAVLQEISTSIYHIWVLYLPADLFLYRLSIYQINRLSPFALIYGRQDMTLSLKFIPLIAQDKSHQY